MKITFTAAKTFYSNETASQYVEGLSYSASAGDRVFSHIMRWIDEGKIIMGGKIAQVSGKGEVHASNASDSDPQRDR
jgi:hypothetical protein